MAEALADALITYYQRKDALDRDMQNYYLEHPDASYDTDPVYRKKVDDFNAIVKPSIGVGP